MEMEWEPRAEATFERLVKQLERRIREGHAGRAREAAETHARTHGLGRVTEEAATVGFVKAASTYDKPQVKNALRRAGLDPRKYEDFF